MTSDRRVLGLAAALVVAGACEEAAPEEQSIATQDEVRALLRVPDHLQTPAYPDFNVPTAAKIELGRHLFYDERLSGNETQACAGCHEQALAFADGLRTPTGSTGVVLARNSQGLANVAYASTLTWANSGLLELEDQIQIPIRADDPVELGVHDGIRDEVLRRFDEDPRYQQLFDDAFPDSDSGATINKIAFALATFCRAMISGNSPYDRFLAGDRDALTPEQARGLALFNSERLECFHCHGGSNLSTAYRDARSDDQGTTQYPFFNNGLYDVDGEGSYPPGNQGLYEVTLDPRHRGLFRPPLLRNVAVTAPYMHDGSIETLQDVVRHYAAGGRKLDEGPFAGDGRLSPLKSGLVRGFEITDEEVEDVVAFLESLTDEAFQ
jgi:cytochrome c peroxidase